MSEANPGGDREPAARPESSTSAARIAVIWILVPLILLVTFAALRH